MPLLDFDDVATADGRIQPRVRPRWARPSTPFTSSSGLGILVVLLGLLLGCDRASLGLPREALSAASPDGEFRAVVRNHPSIDPPRQSLWLYARDGARSRLRRLSEDQDWCDLAVWSPDSRRVVFLVQGIQAVVVDARSRRELLVTDLAPRRGYPPDKTVRDLGFAPAGDALSFRICKGGGDDCGEPTLLRIQDEALPGAFNGTPRPDPVGARWRARTRSLQGRRRRLYGPQRTPPIHGPAQGTPTTMVPQTPTQSADGSAARSGAFPYPSCPGATGLACGHPCHP